MMNELLIELSSTWNSYWKKKTTDKTHRVHQLVLQDIPTQLKAWNANSEKYLYRGSDGQGNILRTPWVATFNPEITNSATKGFYPVYLFKDDMKSLVLELGFGATQFEEKYGRGPRFFQELTIAVEGMQSSSKHLLKAVSPAVRQRLSLAPTSLDTSSDFKLRAYEKCSIYSLTYNLDNLPLEEELQEDYLQMMRLYDAMAGSLILPSEEEFVLEELSTPAVPNNFETHDFVPMKKKKRNNSSGVKQNSAKRYSKSSEKVGRIGEEFVFNVEREKLVKSGRTDLADRVIWHRNFPENRTPGWDITSFDVSGDETYIEVKASTGKTISSVILTVNEWKKALLNLDNDKYQIYLVSNVLVTPSIQILKNPAKWVENGELSIEVDAYLLNLSQDSEEEKD